MRSLIIILLLFSCLLSSFAKQQELSLRQCKHFQEISKLDSVVVFFTAKGNHLSFSQSFSTVGKLKGSRQITLRQRELDYDHFERALAMLEFIVSYSSLSDYEFIRQEIKTENLGLISVFQFEKQVALNDLWKNMYKTFSWLKKTGLADDIQIIIYGP
ncbi:hypothetical protein H6761_00540 [Candidatus Nomurabacteria bacterium]|nr:hypothetical protein [Candidatus Nomurabacteria bacterium]